MSDGYRTARGICDRCGRNIVLTVAGRIPSHYQGRPDIRAPYCPGSGGLPVGNPLPAKTARNKLPVMPKTEKAPTRKLRIRKAYINYRLELADSSQKAVAVLAKTTPATVSRVIAGIRKEGVVTERVWSALRDCAKTPIKDLQDPPEMPEDILPRAR